MSTVLDKVNGIEDLAALSLEELDQLSAEVRSLIVGTVSRTGGHLGSNLGAVELTLALLRVFNPPEDKIVWDVSHQTYAYKILTDRKERFSTLRKKDGISGFSKREESKYDAFGAGHSGTAISAALGMAAARDGREGKEHVVAVLGDGSMGNGISMEALNNVAHTTKKLIVVLNDNEMSIAANVGSTSRYLGQLLANPRYNRWKRSVEGAAKKLHLGWFRRTYYRIEEAIKSIFLRNVVFEEFGLRYVGPIDGHDMHSLMDAMQVARDYGKSIVLHVSTQKGKGYPFAEADPEQWHGTSSFDVATGKPMKANGKPTYSHVFGEVLERLAEKDERICAITAAMPAGTGLTSFAKKYPNRFYDVGICEEHAAVFAAGLATEEQRPFYAVYSTFAQRAVDCIIHDICLQNLPVTMCLDRAGIVGDDGPTHHGVFDIPLLRPIPNLVIAQPKDEAELANLMYSTLKWKKPVAIRYPRGSGTGAAIPEDLEELEIGKAEVIRGLSVAKAMEGGQSSDVRDQPDKDQSKIGNQKSAITWLWALGDMLPIAEQAAEVLAEQGVSVGVVNARFIKPLDKELLMKQADSASIIVSLENGALAGGFGSGLEEALRGGGFKGTVLKYGWPDEFVPHGASDQLMDDYGLNADAIALEIAGLLKK